ncbi:hypothetical protein GCM10011506_25670 [Marivirga lumbricoides]|uniref:Yip1 domain-containing protein n=1 Tax=Marivirga lumbricoides TaxID=1046115 RepID=A0ABQ1MKW7_9BACT|nr:hypothetical protein GCM10011506_25670 [Marivirga lumbricoides]
MTSAPLISTRVKQSIPFLLYFLLYLITVYFLKFKNENFAITDDSNFFLAIKSFKYDLTLAPIIFILKFLYASFFIFTAFNIQQLPIKFGQILKWVILASLIFYLPILLNAIKYYDILHVLNLADLKDVGEYSILTFLGLTTSEKSKLYEGLLKEVNVFNFLYVILLSFLIYKGTSGLRIINIFITVLVAGIVSVLIIQGIVLILMTL